VSTSWYGNGAEANSRSRYKQFDPNSEYPYDTEDALVIWLRLVGGRNSSPEEDDIISIVKTENGKVLRYFSELYLDTKESRAGE
jgi:hypothetical protein